MIHPTRTGLKALACLNVDAEFFKTLAPKLLSYSGERTKDYDEIDKEVQLIMDDLDEEMKTIRGELDATL